MQTKLHRSTFHKSIGGVCAGIADSRGWSISLVRVLWLLLVSVSGLGLALYLVAWVALPNATSVGVTESVELPHDPLRRSRKDRRVAGVCGGLANMLNMDPAIVRVVYLLSVVCGGLGLVSYFYAWAIVPEAPAN